MGVVFDPLLGELRTTDQNLFDSRYARATPAITLYVDKTNGTDAVGKGLTSGSGAFKTWQYCFDYIPPVVNGNITINVSGEAYTETATLRGKTFSGNYTITIQGTKSTIETMAIGSGSAQGAFSLSDSHLYSTIVRGSGTWTTNQRQHKWARVVETGDVRLIDTNNTTTLTLTGYPLTSAPTSSQNLVVEEPATTISDFRVGNGQTNIIVNDVDLDFAAGTNQNLLGKYVDVIFNRCVISYPSTGNSVWTNKDNNVQFSDCFFQYVRMFVRGGTKAFFMGGKMYRGSNTRCMHIDEASTVYVGDGLVFDGNDDASTTGIFMGGLTAVNFNGNTPGQSSSRQFIIMRNFTVAAVDCNTIGAPINVGWGFILAGDDIMPNAQERPTSVSAGKLVDTSVNFTTIGVGIGDKVQNLATNTYALVTAVDSATQLSLDDDVFTGTTQSYRILSAASLNTADIIIALDAGKTIQYQNGIKNAAPSKLHVTGSLGRFYRAITAARTLTIDDGLVNATSGTYAVTLETAVGCAGREHYIVNSGTGVITLNTTSSQTISGVASATITLRQNESIGVSSNGANWIIFKQPYAVAVGASASIARAGGVLFDHFVDANNGTTVETDLYTDTLLASTLATNGDKISAHYGGIFTGAAAATQQLKVYFGGTVIYDSGALSIGIATNYWTVRVECVRVSSSIVRCNVSVSSDFATLFPYSKYTEVTGLTLTNTQILKITGTAAGAGGASNQVTAKQGSISWTPGA